MPPRSDRLIVRLPLHLLGEGKLNCLFAETRANLGEVTGDQTARHLFSLSNDAETGHTIHINAADTEK